MSGLRTDACHAHFYWSRRDRRDGAATEAKNEEGRPRGVEILCWHVCQDIGLSVKKFCFKGFQMDAATSPPARAIVVALDASASMYGNREGVLEALNALLRGDMVAELAGETPLFLYQFNQWLRLMRETTVASFAGVSLCDYEPEGQTALYDALGILIERHANATFVVVSDGRDTASIVEHRESVQQQVEFARAHMGCTFLFVGEGLEADETGRSIGMQPQDMFLTREGLGIVLASNEVGSALSQSMSADMVPPFVAQPHKKPKLAELPASQDVDL
jgi:hypothetical protein